MKFKHTGGIVRPHHTQTTRDVFRFLNSRLSKVKVKQEAIFLAYAVEGREINIDARPIITMMDLLFLARQWKSECVFHPFRPDSSGVIAKDKCAGSSPKLKLIFLVVGKTSKRGSWFPWISHNLRLNTALNLASNCDETR